MPDTHVIVRNRRQQPVELHLPGGVMVLEPGGEARVAEPLLATPQVALLLARKVLDARPVPAPAPAGAAPAAPKRKGGATPKPPNATGKAATRAQRARRGTKPNV